MANILKYQFSAEELINKLYQKGIMGDNDTGFLQTLIDNSLIFNENIPFYQECFSIDGNEKPADLKNTKESASWSVTSHQRRMVPMADAMAPLSETMQLDNEGFAPTTGSMYQYGSGLYQTAQGKIELEGKLKSLDIKDQTILGGYVKGVADCIKAHNSRLSNMAAQTLSKGGAYSNAGQGMTGVLAAQNAYIPLKNFKTAGAKVWSDLTSGTECDIFDQMRKIENDFKEANGIDSGFAMQWDIPYNMAMNVLMKNPKVIADVNRFIMLSSPDKVVIVPSGGNSSVYTNIITTSQLVGYSWSELSKISPIHIVKEKQVFQDFSSFTTTSGWDTGKAVLRPMGLAGVVVHAQPKDIAVFLSGEISNMVTMNIAKAQGFLYVVNKTTNRNLLKDYHLDVIGSYATVLNEIDLHLVVDTTTADS